MEAFGFAGARGLDRLSDFPSEDLAIEEKDSLEDPMLGRGSDVFVESQVGEKGFDFLSAHFWGGVGVYHKKDEAASPGVPGPGVSGRRKNWPVLAVWVGSRRGCSAVLCYTPALPVSV